MPSSAKKSKKRIGLIAQTIRLLPDENTLITRAAELEYSSIQSWAKRTLLKAAKLEIARDEKQQ